MNLKEQLNQLGINTDTGLFLVYGKAGVGKTTFLMELSKNANGKILIVDAEDGFSINRFKQINPERKLEDVIVIKPKDFEEQTKIISKILNNEKLFSFIGIDTIGKLYREERRKDRTRADNEIARQMRVIKEISRKKPVIVCNQVYQNITENKVEPVGKNYVTKWCDHVILLDEVNEKRTMKTTNENKKEFKLNENGFIF